MPYPRITHLGDLLPHIRDDAEIAIRDLEYGVRMVCYQIARPGLFRTPWHRECRGIMFDRDGAICSRPLHKFFNVGEPDGYTWEQMASVAFPIRGQSLVLGREKYDGSMVATALVDGVVRWRSKQTFAHPVARAVAAALTPEQHAWVERMVQNRCTVIGEWIASNNRIVLEYPAARFQLLAMRDTVTGDYLSISLDAPFEQVPSQWHPASYYRDHATMLTEREGWVVAVGDDFAKIKTTWYVAAHRVLTGLTQRGVCDAVLDGTFDDLRAAWVSYNRDPAPLDAVHQRVLADADHMTAIVHDEIARTAGLTIKERAFAWESLVDTRPLLFRAAKGQPLQVLEWLRRRDYRLQFPLDGV